MRLHKSFSFPNLDEMSLLAADFFYNVHRRFVEILQQTDMFADRGVMLVGDLMQIPPVRNQQHGNIDIININSRFFLIK